MPHVKKTRRLNGGVFSLSDVSIACYFFVIATMFFMKVMPC